MLPKSDNSCYYETEECGLYQGERFVKEECLICSAPLEYLETDILMECAICHKKENSHATACAIIIVEAIVGSTKLVEETV